MCFRTIIILITIRFTVSTLEIVNEKCNEAICITLYKNDISLTWDAARRMCEEEDGKRLVAIRNNEIHNQVTEIISSVEGITAWTGGRRSDDNTWRTLDKKEFGRSVSTGENSADTNCIFGRRQDKIFLFEADECTEKRGNHIGICQTDDVNDDCSHNVNGSCYVNVTDTDVDITEDPSWFEVQNICESRSPGKWRLLDDTRAVVMTELVPPARTVWLGYLRKPWFWLGMSDPVRYFQWTRAYEDAGQVNQCIVVSSDQYWTPEDCNTGLDYFLCSNETQVIVTNPTTSSVEWTSSSSSSSSSSLPKTSATLMTESATIAITTSEATSEQPPPLSPSSPSPSSTSSSLSSSSSSSSSSLSSTMTRTRTMTRTSSTTLSTQTRPSMTVSRAAQQSTSSTSSLSPETASLSLSSPSLPPTKTSLSTKARQTTMELTVAAGPTTEVTTATSRPTMASPSTSSQMSPTSSGSSGENDRRDLYLSIFLPIGFVVLAVIFIVVLVCISRRKKKKLVEVTNPRELINAYYMSGTDMDMTEIDDNTFTNDEEADRDFKRKSVVILPIGNGNPTGDNEEEEDYSNPTLRHGVYVYTANEKMAENPYEEKPNLDISDMYAVVRKPKRKDPDNGDVMLDNAFYETQ